MIEPGADFGGKSWLGHHVAPVEQQVVVIEYVVALLRGDVGAEERFEFVDLIRAPGECRGERIMKFGGGIHGMGIDCKARVFGRKARSSFGEAEFAAHEVHEVGGVRPVQHCEGRIQSDRVGVQTEQPVGDAVESP